MEHTLAVPQEAIDNLMEGILALLRILWNRDISGTARDSTLHTYRNELLAQLTRDCESLSPTACEDIMNAWLAAAATRDGEANPTTFDALCERLLPAYLSSADARYWAMRSIRRHYKLGLSYRTAAAAHSLTRVLSELFEQFGSREVTLQELNRAMETRPRPADEKGRAIEIGLRKAFIDVSLVLNLFEFSSENQKLTLRPEVTDPEYMVSNLFGMSTAIVGFDLLFGGGGLVLTDSLVKQGDGPEPWPDPEPGIGSRSILCLGPFGSGKTLLSLQFAVEVARKGGVAWVMTLEQTPEECLYALEGIGVSTTQAGFVVAHNLSDSFRALIDPAPIQGALVFLRPTAEDQADYTAFLVSVEKKLGWMSTYPLRLLVVDPINALVQQEGKGPESRAATRRMFEAAKRNNVNVWFTSEQISKEPESNHFAENIADTVIHLDAETTQGPQRRYVQITKCRFQQEASGRHGLVIDSHHGIQVHPSSALIAQTSARRISVPRPRAGTMTLPFGVPGIERLLGGEPVRPGEIIVLAGPGKAKTLVGVKFLLAQASQSDGYSLFVSDSTSDQMDWLINTTASQARQQLISKIETCALPTGYVDPGRVLQEIRRAFERCESKGKGISRVLLTNLAHWEEEMPFVMEDRVFGIALVALLRSYRAATVIVCGDTMDRGSPLRDTMFDQADTLLHFNRKELKGRITTLLTAVKTRSMRHQRELFELAFEQSGVEVRPAPLVRLKASGDVEPIRISLFLHAETANHKEHNEGVIGALKATISNASIAEKDRRFDPSLLSISDYSAVDELQVFQLDEYQLPTIPAKVFSPSALYSFDTKVNAKILEDRLAEFTCERILCDNGNRFLAVPFYANLSFFAVHHEKLETIRREIGFDRFPESWAELARLCKEWDERHPDSEALFFSCAIYEHSIETYNCLFFEILSNLQPPPEGDSVDLSIWVSGPKAEEAGHLLWLLCRRSHARVSEKQSFITNAAICRHWYNTLNQELSRMSSEERAQISVEPLFDDCTTAGEWYLAIPSYSASPEIGLRLIEQLTSLDRETLRVELGVGLPTRTAYYQAPEARDTSVSRFFRFPRSDVYRLLKRAIRRSAFMQYQRLGSTVSSHLQWILEIPCQGGADSTEGSPVRQEIGRAIKSLAGNLRFLMQSTNGPEAAGSQN